MQAFTCASHRILYVITTNNSSVQFGRADKCSVLADDSVVHEAMSSDDG